MDQTRNYPAVDSEVGLLDYWRAVWSRKWLIVGLCAIATVITFFYSLRLPKIYTATATILAPKEDLTNAALPLAGAAGRLLGGGGGEAGGRSGLPSLLGEIGGGGALSLMPGLTPNLSFSLAMLRSRTMREEVVAHFKQSWGPQVEPMIGSIRVEAGKDDIVSLTAESRDPKLAAELANFYFEHLQKMAARRAEKRREREHEFYLGQVDQARKDYKAAQGDLIAFQEQNRTLALDSGTKSSIDAGATAGGSVIALEIHREMRRMSLTENHPEMIALNRQIYETKRLLSHQLYGEAQPLPPEKPGAPPRKEFFVASTKMTPLYFKMVEFYRDFRMKETLYSLLAQHIGSYKYNKNVAPAAVDWLDPALPPGGPSRPNIQYNVTAAAVASLVVGIFLALVLEYLERVRQAAARARTYATRRGRGLAPARENAHEAVAAEFPDAIVSGGPPFAESRAEGSGRRRTPLP